ncbi:MAG TPA: cell wall hydrolase [Clostridia bacterium]|nr:cell wall hydrolase [Clostridia bacterium]
MMILELWEQCNLSKEDFEFMARVVAAEAGTTHWDNQVAVASVIWNRVSSDHFPDTVEGVLTESGQFSTVNHGDCSTPTVDACRRAIVYAYLNRPLPEDVLFFRAFYYFSGLKHYAKVADNYFSYE